MTLPPLTAPALAGTTFHHAYHVFDLFPWFATYDASNPAPVMLVP